MHESGGAVLVCRREENWQRFLNSGPSVQGEARTDGCLRRTTTSAGASMTKEKITMSEAAFCSYISAVLSSYSETIRKDGDSIEARALAGKMIVDAAFDLMEATIIDLAEENEVVVQ
jgi:hypothetical protein